MHTTAALAIEWVIVVFIAAIGVLVLWRLFLGHIDLTGLLSEPADPATPGIAGKASLSRLQLLLFTFVIVGLYLTLCLEAGSMIDIPNQVLGLLGISSGSFLVSKGIAASATTPPAAPAPVTVVQPVVVQPAGQGGNGGV